MMQEHRDKTLATRNRLFIAEPTNVTDKRIVDSNINNTNESVVDKLRYIKQQRAKRSRTRLCDLNDAKISSNAFVESARVLDSVCNSSPTTRIIHKPTRPLGLVPFVVLERCDVKQWESGMHSGSATHWSLEEENEEDIFAEAKDETENIVEFSQWEYNLLKSPECSFSGFSLSEIQCSRDEDARFTQLILAKDLLKYKEDNDTTQLRGFLSAEINISERIANDWRRKTEKYYSKDAFGRNCLVRSPLDATRTSCDGFAVSEICTTAIDGHSDSPHKKMQGLLSKENKYMNNERQNYGDLEHLSGRKSLPNLETYSSSTCRFTATRGRSTSISKTALEKADTIYSAAASSIKIDVCENSNLKDYPKSENSPKFAINVPNTSSFSTAGGRSISISKTALKNAETIYSEEVSSIKKDFYDNSNFKNSPKSENSSKLTIIAPSTSGFSTAGGRSITISKTALQKAETIYSEEILSIEKDFCDNSNIKDSRKSENSSKLAINAPSTSGFSTAGGRSISISKTALKKAETIYSEEVSSIEKDFCDNSNIKDSRKSENSSKLAINAPSTSGFSTAGGLSISISKTALKKAETIYSEEISSIEKDFCENSNIKDSRKSENSSKLAINAPSTSGFSTAGGRSISISKTALKKAEMIYSEDVSSIEKDFCDNSNIKDSRKSENSSKLAINAPSTSGFSTAGGRSISISKTALKKAEMIYSEDVSSIKKDFCDNSNFKDSPTSENSSKLAIIAPSTSGFSTAGGRSISISKTALKKAERIYSEEVSSIEKDFCDNSNIKDSRKSENSSKLAMNPPSTSGFSTAGGRSISISKTALKKAETIYSEEISSIEKDFCDNSNIKDSRKSENSSKLAINAPSTSGFSTAGGRSINISKTALKKAETIYSLEASSIEEDSCDNNNLKEVPEFEISPKFATNTTNVDGFATTASRSINISESSVVKSRKREFSELEDCEAGPSTWKTPKCNAEDTIHKRNVKIGFATARGHELKVSETALSKAKALLDEDESLADSALASKNVSSTAKSTVLDEKNSSTVEETQLAADLDYMESINFDDFMDPIEEELSKKRKIDTVDDETPLRGETNWKQKRGRYVNELQRKKLFFEDSNWDDDASTKKSSRDATAAVFLEDPEPSDRLNEWKNRKSSCAKTEPEIPALRKSISPQCVVTKNIQKTTKLCPVASTSSNVATRIGRNSLDNQPESIPDDLTFDTQFTDDEFSPLLDEFILETMKIMEARLAMTRKQDETIRGKRRTKPQHCDGYLYKLRIANSNSRISWRELTGGTAPELRQISNKTLENDVRFVTANSAESYSFLCSDLFGKKNAGLNAEGIKIGDDAFLILDEKNRAGVCEFERAFLASPGVDPNLVPTGWVKNHYRWIVWKLASMDRVNFGHKYLPRMLTPDRVMYELKYRYDREIYRTQWPPLRRILEKNEDSSARIVLCVSSITVTEGNRNAPRGSNTPNSLGGPLYKMKLTDGWYCIDASIDAAMNNCIKNGKVKEGTKLMTVGAKTMNLDQGCSALEIPGDVTLRIHTNSTRRVRWNTKLDYYRTNPGPMLLSLKSIKPNGGMICKLIVAVARLYPILYREKLPDGQFVFRNARCDEEAALAHEARHQAKMDEILANARAEFQADLGNRRGNERTKNRICMEQSFREREDELRQMITSKLRECLPPPRDVTPVMKIRIAEGETSAMLTVWSNERDNTEIFVEGSSIAIYNSFASRQRLNELQITAGRSTFMKLETTRRIVYPERIFTSLAVLADPGFNPVYGEFDTIGIVSSIGPAPHGMKNFDTVNLACPRANEDNASNFLSVLFWQGVSTHGYSKILTIGSLVACSNLEWRKNTAKSIPTAYCTERSVFSKNPRQSHLNEAFETLRRQIKEPLAYAATCATMIEEEIAKKMSLRTPCKGTPYRPVTSNSLTPIWTPRDSRNSTSAYCTPGFDSKKASTKKRLEKLEVYGEAPKLPSIVINNSSRKVLSDFRSPVVTPVTKS